MCPGSRTVLDGAQGEDVNEPFERSRAVVSFEFDDYPEAKALSKADLDVLYGNLKSFYLVGEVIGASEAFARHNVKQRRFLKGRKRRR